MRPFVLRSGRHNGTEPCRPGRMRPQRSTLQSPVQFLAGGTTLDRSHEARRDAAGARDRHQCARRLGTGPDRRQCQRPAARRARAHGGRSRSRRDQSRLSGHRPVAEARGQPAGAQHGEPRRQCPAAHPLSLFPRRFVRRVQQAQSGLGLRGARRLQPLACRARNQRSMHRQLSRRFRPGLDRARRHGGDRRSTRHAHHPVRRTPSQAGRRTRDRNELASRRNHHLVSHSGSSLDPSLGFSQDPRPRVL